MLSSNGSFLSPSTDDNCPLNSILLRMSDQFIDVRSCYYGGGELLIAYAFL
jgi:hypothetical protein